jgi:hypothetical protein
MPVVYVGGAHRWPHKHLEWSARLGYEPQRQPHIQIMVMPTPAYERVSRALPNIRKVEWEMSSSSFQLYNTEKRRWSMNSSLITNSLDRHRSLRQLTSEFHGKRQGVTLSIDKEQAKVLDLISWGIFLRSLETGQYSDYYEIDIERIRDILIDLQTKNAFFLQYSLVMLKLTSVCLLADGPVNNVLSLARAFLKHAPSAHVRVTDGGKSCSIIARIPEDKTYSFLETLSSSAAESDVSVRAFPISAYVGYRNNLYQRLLKQDGTWDDDVSGLLDQVRLRSSDEPID